MYPPNRRTDSLTFAGSEQFGGSRPPLTITGFVCAMLLVLAILVGALIVRLFKEAGRIKVDTVAIIGAMLIAVLPVRAVLVPAAIGSLVLVDYALALLMGVLVAGLVAAQLRSRAKWDRLWLMRKIRRRSGR
jgi:hypothetical protein